MTDFSPLFQAGSIGRLVLDNRLIMAAMGNTLADGEGRVSDKMIAYYQPRAKGGVALVITQFVSVCPDDVMPYSLGLYNDSFLPGIRRLVDAVHSCGSKISIQLMHPGMLLQLLRSIPESMTVKVPGTFPWLKKDLPYREVGEGEMEEYIEQFALGALRVKEAGADAVELHACHGCLVSTFLSPVTNHRTDLYGGSVDNRTRFPRRIVEKMRASVGSEFPITVRINGSDGVPGGVTEGEVIEQAGILEAAGADGISVSAGLEYWSSVTAPCSLSPDGFNVPVAHAVKNEISAPVIVAGKIPPKPAAEILRDGKADFVALGRPLLADPELPKKLREGREEEICPCLYCNNCMRSMWRSCTVNPFLYREEKAEIIPAEAKKQITVVGGGIAGMQAAVLLGKKRHRVTLYEKQNELGGQWLAAGRLPGRQRFCVFLDYLKHMLDANGVKVVLGRLIGKEEVRKEKPDIVVIATGGVPRSSSSEGQHADPPTGKVFHGVDAIPPEAVIQAVHLIPAHPLTVESPLEPGSAVVVIGGSTVSMEEAVMLSDRGHGVTLVSPGRLGGRRGPEEKITFRAVMEMLLARRIPIHEDVEISATSRRGVVVIREAEPYLIPADFLVLSLGTEADDALVRELEGVPLEVYSVGDCVQPGTAAQATYGAASLALRL